MAFRLAKGETEEEVTVLLNDVYRRGLEGKQLKLIAFRRGKRHSCRHQHGLSLCQVATLLCA